MPSILNAPKAINEGQSREHLLWVLSAATFMIFFQAYMIAPLIPRLAQLLGESPQRVGGAIPAYLIPYGLATLFYGLLADRIGPRRIIVGSLLAFVVLTGLTATARSANELIVWRGLTGIGASGVIPIGLALIGQLFPYAERGRPLGWLFGAMAGGAAFGSTLGSVLEPYVGWPSLFVGVAGVSLALLGWLWRATGRVPIAKKKASGSLSGVLTGYYTLLLTMRGLRTYTYVFLNGVFHSGVFTWLGLYFKQRFGLDEVGIGLALLGYGVPGFLLGPYIGKLADQKGRRWLIPLGLALSAVATMILIFDVPLLVAALGVTILSLGYDLTQPLLAGIVTDLGKNQPGQAMGLNVFMLFVGFGVGSFLFGQLLEAGLPTALTAFTVGQLVISMAAVAFFAAEKRKSESN